MDQKGWPGGDLPGRAGDIAYGAQLSHDAHETMSMQKMHAVVVRARVDDREGGGFEKEAAKAVQF